MRIEIVDLIMCVIIGTIIGNIIARIILEEIDKGE
jgi:large-conductance mechanosensitive channel